MARLTYSAVAELAALVFSALEDLVAHLEASMEIGRIFTFLGEAAEFLALVLLAVLLLIAHFVAFKLGVLVVQLEQRLLQLRREVQVRARYHPLRFTALADLGDLS